MANRYWVGTGTWNTTNTANWSTASNGTGGASVPGTADAVIFNSSSGNCTLGSTVDCLTLTMTGYTGTFNAGTSNYQININSIATATVFVAQTAGTISGYPLISLTGEASATTRTITALTGASGSKWNVVYTTTQYTNSLVFTNNSIFNDVSVSGSTTITNTTVTFQGNVSFSGGATRTAGTAVLTLSSQTSSIKTLYLFNTCDCPITFDSPNGGGYKLTYFINCGARAVTLTSGTLDLNGYGILACGSFNSTGTIARTLIFGTGSYIALYGSATIWNVGSASSSTLTITGTSDVRVVTSVAVTLNPGTPTEANAINFTSIYSGTLTLNTGNYGDLNLNSPSAVSTTSGNCTIYGSLTNLSIVISTGLLGTFTLATSGSKTLSCGTGGSFGNPLVVDCTGTYTLTSDLTTAKVFTLTRGTLNLNNNNISALSFSSSNQNTRSLVAGNKYNNPTSPGYNCIYVSGSNSTIVEMSDMTNFTVSGTVSSVPGSEAPTIVSTYAGSTNTRTIRMGTTVAPTEDNTLSFISSTAATDTITIYNGSSYKNLYVANNQGVGNYQVKITGAITTPTKIYGSYGFASVNILSAGGNVTLASSRTIMSDLYQANANRSFLYALGYTNHPTTTIDCSGSYTLVGGCSCSVIFKKGTLNIGYYYKNTSGKTTTETYNPVIFNSGYTFDIQGTDYKLINIAGKSADATDQSIPGSYLSVNNFNSSGNSSFRINSTGKIVLSGNNPSFNSGSITDTFPIIELSGYGAGSSVYWFGSAKFTNLYSASNTSATISFNSTTPNTFIDFNAGTAGYPITISSWSDGPPYATLKRVNGNWSSNTSLTNNSGTLQVTLGYSVTTPVVTYKNNFFLMF
jgi:hypothetical protein